MRRTDNEGRTICPSCGKAYIPKLNNAKSGIPIQQQFPEAKLIDREQMISGICSNKCWERMTGIPSRDTDSHNCKPLKHFIKTDKDSKGFSYDQAVNWR
jgi:hypothetical protein